MNDIRTKIWSRLKYKDPKTWLVKLDRIEKEIVPKVVRTRPRLLKKWANEARQAGLLTYGMQQLTGRRIGFSMLEDSDFDFLARFDEEGVENYIPVQLKEWVPEALNSTQSLEDIFVGLRSYTDQKDLTVGIYVSRNITLKPSEIRLIDTNFNQVWLFGSCSTDDSRWFVCGDIQNEFPHYFEFDYPTAS